MIMGERERLEMMNIDMGGAGMTDKSSFRKTWEVLFPYMLYYLTYNAAYLILAFVHQETLRRGVGAYGQFVTAYAVTVAGVMGGLCMLIGILPLVPMLREELRRRQETADEAAGRIDGDAGAVGRIEKVVEVEGRTDGEVSTVEKLTQMVNGKSQRAGSMAVFTVVLACCVSLGLNALLTMTGFVDSSQTYQEVAARQYRVAFALGLVLYGIISPLAEEVVFRGVIYNRLRRLFNPTIGIIVSGILFGAFHGNLVQAVYGACLGMLMAYLYERSGNFWIPILFHAAANLAVYTTARMEGVQETLFTPGGCVVLLAVSAGCVWVQRRLGKARSAGGSKS